MSVRGAFQAAKVRLFLSSLSAFIFCTLQVELEFPN
jgi:hypothetical protein